MVKDTGVSLYQSIFTSAFTLMLREPVKQRFRFSRQYSIACTDAVFPVFLMAACNATVNTGCHIGVSLLSPNKKVSY